jgi:hypothetical protein
MQQHCVAEYTVGLSVAIVPVILDAQYATLPLVGSIGLSGHVAVQMPTR